MDLPLGSHPTRMISTGTLAQPPDGDWILCLEIQPGSYVVWRMIHAPMESCLVDRWITMLNGLNLKSHHL